MSASPLISDESSRENQSSKHDLDYFVGQISVRWYKSTDCILEIADLCVEAVRTLGPTDRKKLWKQVGFAKGTFSKLGKIGNDERLRGETVRGRLPPHYTMLYEITKLNDAKLDSALKDGVIRCDMQRNDLSAWLQKSSDPKPKLLATLVSLEGILKDV